MKYFNLVIFIGWIIILNSCYESKEGCLDPLSSNYDVSSDNDCTDCCIYPSISWKLDHQNGDITLILGDTIFNNLNDSFLVLDQKFYISGVSVYDVNGIKLPLRDSINYNISNQSTTLLNDVTKVEKNIVSLNFNKYRFEDKVASLEVNFGLPEQYDYIKQSSIPSNSSIVQNNNILYNDLNLKYYSAYFKIIAGEALTDTLDLFLTTDHTFHVNYLSPISAQKGKELKLTLVLDYAALYKDVDFRSGDIQTPGCKLVGTVEMGDAVVTRL